MDPSPCVREDEQRASRRQPVPNDTPTDGDAPPSDSKAAVAWRCVAGYEILCELGRETEESKPAVFWTTSA